MQVAISGRLVKAYRTGNRMRYRSKDGKMEFFDTWSACLDLRIQRRTGRVGAAILGSGLVCDVATVLEGVG